MNNTLYTIANVYAPTRGSEREQVNLLKSLSQKLDEFAQENIVGGDFNVHLDPKLDRSEDISEVNSSEKYRTELLTLLENPKT